MYRSACTTNTEEVSGAENRLLVRGVWGGRGGAFKPERIPAHKHGYGKLSTRTVKRSSPSSMPV